MSTITPDITTISRLDEADEEDLKHIARVVPPPPPAGTWVTALCGAKFRLRGEVIFWAREDMCAMCVVMRNSGLI